uniref:Uncharacterized protein n=1 Tax=Rhizophagus irregularis (strain DAOM 181602 / DAOM 197198 / MUCL 43194) TaxID=747089 RepID=U9T3R8_RHIID
MGKGNGKVKKDGKAREEREYGKGKGKDGKRGTEEYRVKIFLVISSSDELLFKIN